MNKIAKAAVEAGLVDVGLLNEMRRWGVPLPDANPQEHILNNKDAVVAHLREAIESKEQVDVDETELDLLSRYLDSKHQKKGRLILKEGKKHQTLNITFCLTVLGEYAIPWTSDETPDILINGETHLKWTNDEGQDLDVYFRNVREASFGDRKAFAVCEVNND